MSNRKRRVGAESRRIDVEEMRENARLFLGWQELTTSAAAEFIDVAPRTWRRFESKEKTIADSQIKLFWYEVALTKLEQTEENASPDQLEALLGGPVTMKRVFDFCFNAWEQWDPSLKKEEAKAEQHKGQN